MRPLEFSDAEDAWVARYGTAYQKTLHGIGVRQLTPQEASRVSRAIHRETTHDMRCVCPRCGGSKDRRAQVCGDCRTIFGRRKRGST